jgi:hypothetical protein
MKWVVVPLCVAAAACLADRGAGSGADVSGKPGHAESARDLTLPTGAAEVVSVSAVERGRLDVNQATVRAETAGETPVASVPERVAYSLRPAAATLPEALMVAVPSREEGPIAAAVRVAALPSGRTVGAPTPEPIVWSRPGRVSLDEPYEFAGLARAYTPEEARGIGIRRRGGSCGPAGGLWAGH